MHSHAPNAHLPTRRPSPIKSVGLKTASVNLPLISFPSSPVTILHGPNGWGKTSIFRAVSRISDALIGNLAPLAAPEFEFSFVELWDGTLVTLELFGELVRVGVGLPDEAIALVESGDFSGDAETCRAYIFLTYDQALYDSWMQHRNSGDDSGLHQGGLMWKRIADLAEAASDAAAEREHVPDEYSDHSDGTFWLKNALLMSENMGRRIVDESYQLSRLSWKGDDFAPATPKDAVSPLSLEIHPSPLALSSDVLEEPDRDRDYVWRNWNCREVYPIDAGTGYDAPVNLLVEASSKIAAHALTVNRLANRHRPPIETELTGRSGFREVARTTRQPLPGSYEALQNTIQSWIDRTARDALTTTLVRDDTSSKTTRGGKEDSRGWMDDLVRFGFVDPAIVHEAGPRSKWLTRAARETRRTLEPAVRRLRLFENFVTRGLNPRLECICSREHGFQIVARRHEAERKLSKELRESYERYRSAPNFTSVVAPWNLSSGNEQRISLAGAILFEAPPGSIVLIDEPELSLDPAWQRMLVADFKEMAEVAGVSIVLSTHSPLIASGHTALLVPEIDVPTSGDAEATKLLADALRDAKPAPSGSSSRRPARDMAQVADAVLRLASASGFTPDSIEDLVQLVDPRFRSEIAKRIAPPSGGGITGARRRSRARPTTAPATDDEIPF